MQAIQTKYLGATDTKPSRIKAWCERGSLTIGYPHDLSGDAVHAEAAKALVEKFLSEDENAWGASGVSRENNPWSGEMVSGCLPDGSYAHIILPLEAPRKRARMPLEGESAAKMIYASATTQKGSL